MKYKTIWFLLLFILLISCKKESTEETAEENDVTAVEEEELNENSCIVTLIKGNANRINEEKNIDDILAVGDTLHTNDTITTESNSNVELQIGEGSIVRIKENSKLTISTLYKDEDQENTGLFLDSGKFLVNPEKQSEEDSFEVSTVSVTAGVRGTQFTVIVDENETRSKSIAIPPFFDPEDNSEYSFLSTALSDGLNSKLLEDKILSLSENKAIMEEMQKMQITSKDLLVKETITRYTTGLNVDYIAVGKYSVTNDEQVNLDIRIFDREAREVAVADISGSFGIEVFDYISGLGTILSQKLGEDNPINQKTKIEVYEGEVVCKKKVNVEEISDLKEMDSEIGELLEKQAEVEVVLTANEQIIIRQDKVVDIESKLTQKTVEIIEELEKSNNDVEKREEVKERFVEKETVEIAASTEIVFQKEEIDHSKETAVVTKDEFEEMENRQKILSVKLENTETKEKVEIIKELAKSMEKEEVEKVREEEKRIAEEKKKEIAARIIEREKREKQQREVRQKQREKEQQREKEAEKEKKPEKKEEKVYSDVIAKTEQGSYKVLDLTEYQEETPEKFVIKLEKLNLQTKDRLISRDTTVRNNDKFIIVTSNTNKSLYCIEPGNKEIKWTFTADTISYINSPAVLYNDTAILAADNTLHVIDMEKGTIKQQLELRQSTTFWASPIQHKNDLIIPLTKALYLFNGETLEEIEEFSDTRGQLYISSYNQNLFVVDSIYAGIRGYDMEKRAVTWESEQLKEVNIFTTPVVYEDYLVIANSENDIYRFNHTVKSQSPLILRIGVGIASNFIPHEEYVYFVAQDGFFYRLDIEGFDYVEKLVKVDKNADLNTYLTKRLEIIDGKIYVASDTGNLFYYDVETNNHDFIETGSRSPLVGNAVQIGEKVYFLDSKFSLYSINGQYE